MAYFVRFALGMVTVALFAGCGGSQLPSSALQRYAEFPASSAARILEDAGKYSLIYALRPRDGESPHTLIYYKGDIFGETFVGGDPSCSCGVVFKLSPVGIHYKYTRLHVFTGANDGAGPSSLIATSSGSLYGTTSEGGGTGCSYSGYVGCGTVFKLTPTGSTYTYRVIYRLKGNDDGYSPVLARDQKVSDTNPILGAANGGKGGTGFLFKLVPSGKEYAEHALWDFGRKPGADGVNAPIVVDGAMYGTAHGNFGAYTYAYRFESGGFTVPRKFRTSKRQNM